MRNKNYNQIMSVLAAFFAALICVGAYISFPIPGSPIPVVLQNMFILLTGLVLGPLWGFVSISIYLLLGIIGLPVFSGGGKGIAHIMGPTGGYLLSYIIAVVIIGLITYGKRPGLIRCYAALIIASIIIYAIGVTWLKMKLGFTFEKAIKVGMLPYLIGDGIKIIIAGSIGWKLKPAIHEMM